MKPVAQAHHPTQPRNYPFPSLTYPTLQHFVHRRPLGRVVGRPSPFHSQTEQLISVMDATFIRSLPLCFMCMILLPQAFSLTCYECQERRAGEWCSNPKKRECNAATSICLKYLHKEGKPGFPNHVMAKCDLRSYHTQNKINACELSVRNRNGALTVSETCTCDTDLCNDATLAASKMVQAKPANKMATVAPTEAIEVKDADEGEGNEDHEASDDEAVESHSPEVKHVEKETSEEKSSNSAANAISQVYNALAVVGLQLVFLCSLMSLRM